MKSKLFQFKNKNTGFTLIETLVAITILMISIVGPLTIASKGLTAAVGSRDQVIASYLAQDAMEYIKNIRDSDLLADSNSGWTTFLNFLNSNSLGCATGIACGIETGLGGSTYTQGSLLRCDTFSISSCNLYIDATNKYYTHSSSGNIPTLYNRSFTVTKEDPSLSDAALVTVTVTWKNGNVGNSVVLTSMLFNTPR